MLTKEYKVDLCVVGGGLSGLCCAIAAARKGITVALVQDRAVLGGNSSEEIRMWVCGAHGKDNRETGIIEEIQLENFYQNQGLKYPLWDSVLYEKAKAEPNLTLLLNCSCFDATMDGAKIHHIRAWQSNAETFHVVEARYFADCSGDGILAPLTNAEFMYGREAKRDFNETIPPDERDNKTMGMSCLFQIRETDHYVKYTPPKWAYKFENDDELPFKDHNQNDNFWWIEVGGEWDCIHDTDRCRDELLKICYGVWDHMKNYGDHGVDNWELEWIGFVPGKRESRRYLGEYVVTQNDIEGVKKFDDVVAYGGWSMDDHFPQGFYYKGGEPNIHHPAPSPWALPLRVMISRNIDNLTFAGRNISVTHAALSSSRVMATCATLGQALGTAIAQAVCTVKDIREIDIKQLQQTLMDDDCYIPFCEREISDITKKAKCNFEIVRNGYDRGEDNCWKGKTGEVIEYQLEEDTEIEEITLVFDSDLNRDYHNMPCSYPLNETKYKLPKTLIKKYTIEATDCHNKKYSINVDDNHQRMVKHKVNWKVNKIKLIPNTTHGDEAFRVFRFDFK